MSDEFGFGPGVAQSETLETVDEKKERAAIPVAPKGPGKHAVKTQKRYDIRIDPQDGEPRDIKIGVNGKVYQIWRGTIVSVPEEVVEVLRNAVATKLVTVFDNAGNPAGQEWQDQSAVPYSVLKGPY